MSQSAYTVTVGDELYNDENPAFSAECRSSTCEFSAGRVVDVDRQHASVVDPSGRDSNGMRS